MKTGKQEVIFSLEDVNGMLNYLGDIPSKYSMDLIAFIRGKAQTQLDAQAAAAAEVSDAEVVE